MAQRSLLPSRRLRLEPLEVRRLLATVDLALLPASQGTVLRGEDAGDESGYSVAMVGDVNGDGYDDFLIGAPRSAGSNNGSLGAGEAYLILGSPSLPSPIDLTQVGTTLPGTKIFGVDVDDASGQSVGRAGDFNGDGFDDFVIGAYLADGPGNAKADSGEAYLLFGSAALPPTILLSTVGQSTPGISIYGVDSEDYSSVSVRSAGDINGDGLDDLLLGAYKGDGLANSKSSAGESYVLYGNTLPPGSIDLANVGSSVAGLILRGVDTNDYSGRAVNAAGDFNGDGFDDLAIGAPYADGSGNTRNYTGDVYILFGSGGLASSIDLATIGTTTSGSYLYGATSGDYTGRAVSSAGDINGDGFDDLLIGAHFGDGLSNAKYNVGDSYLVFGSATPPAVINLANVGGSVPGSNIYGRDNLDQSGFAVSLAGDINGDGFDDLLIGAYAGDAASNAKTDAGEAYVIFGGPALASAIDLSQVDVTVPGLVLYGADADDFLGRALSGGDDINGDGFHDFLLGAHRSDGVANLEFYAGESYLLFGSNHTSSVTHLGSSASETLVGSMLANVMVGGQGDDELQGNGGSDVLIGGEGDDRLVVHDLAFRRLVGGNGRDTLTLMGSGLGLNLTTLRDNRILGIEAIDIRGSGNNTLTLNHREVLNLSDESNRLTVYRNAGDFVNIGVGWTVFPDAIAEGKRFQVYKQGNAELWVESVESLIVQRQIFYHRSTSSVFGNGSGNPIQAIDPTKTPLLPGQTSSFANYTNYVLGLNGLLLDMASLPGPVSSADFQFALWDGINPLGFQTFGGPATISVIAGGGTLGTSRVKIEFPDHAVRNTWLRVTVLANANTGLAANDVFYFGNVVADYNVGNIGTPVTVRVNATDTSEVRARQSPGLNSVGISHVYDVNKDGRVNSTDTSLTRQNQSPAVIRHFTAPVALQNLSVMNLTGSYRRNRSTLGIDEAFANFSEMEILAW